MHGKDIFLEDSKGKKINNPAKDDMLAAIEKIGSSIEYCILNLDSEISFIQAAGSMDKLLIQYSDNSGIFESTDCNLRADETAGIFWSAANSNFSWKSERKFKLISSNEKRSAASPASFTGKSFKEQFIDAVRSEAAGNITKLVRKGVIGLFKK